MNYEDILYREAGGVATITINRPSVYNAFRARTVDELLHAFQQAGWNPEIGVIVLTGAGDQAFCTGGDQTSHGDGGYGGRGHTLRTHPQAPAPVVGARRYSTPSRFTAR